MECLNKLGMSGKLPNAVRYNGLRKLEKKLRKYRECNLIIKTTSEITTAETEIPFPKEITLIASP